MSRFPFQNYILNFSVLIVIYLTVLPYHFNSQLSLQHTGLLCICANVIKPVPLPHIFRNRFSVKKYNRHIMFFCNIYNFRRICPIYQIHTKDVASCIYQLFHLVILRALRSGSIFNCHSRLNSILVEMIKFFFKTDKKFA